MLKLEKQKQTYDHDIHSLIISLSKMALQKGLVFLITILFFLFTLHS